VMPDLVMCLVAAMLVALGLGAIVLARRLG
jgi:hypothetical protein